MCAGGLTLKRRFTTGMKANDTRRETEMADNTNNVTIDADDFAEKEAK